MNIGNGNPIQLMDFIDAMETATGKTLLKQFMEAQPGDVAFTHADASTLQNRFGVAPKIDVKEGVKEYFKSIHQQPENPSANPWITCPRLAKWTCQLKPADSACHPDA